MTTPMSAASRPSTAQAATTTQHIGGPLLAPPVALATARVAIGLGIAADALLRAGPGLALPIFVALVSLGAIALVVRAGGNLRGESVAWLVVAVVMSAGFAWRESEPLLFFDFVAMMGALCVAAATIHDEQVRAFSIRIRALIWGGVRPVIGAIAGFGPFLLWDLRESNTGKRWTRTAAPLVRTVLLVVGLAVVFGALLRGADPIFASFVALPSFNIETLVSHIFLIGFFAWTLAGALRSTLAAPTRVDPLAHVPPFRLGMLEVTASLATLDVLFAAFVAAQLGWLFGGEQFLRARTGLTAAEYARQGVFQTVWTVVLLVPLLVALRAAVSNDERAKARNTALSLPLIALVGVTIVSAVLRMRLYVSYFGMSTERLYALVILVWLGVVLAWLAATMVSRREQMFVGGSIATGLLTLAALNAVSPDLLVARMNVARAASNPAAAQSLDLEYLARLGGEAMPVAVPAVLNQVSGGDIAQRCMAARHLLDRWGPASRTRATTNEAGAWRAWNAGTQAALTVVNANVAALTEAASNGCPKPKAASSSSN